LTDITFYYLAINFFFVGHTYRTNFGFLGFHTLGLYVLKDVMLAFGTPKN
ncbi:PsaA_PsaB domain-containing protein, partial [Cephalotus follicularis]